MSKGSDEWRESGGDSVQRLQRWDRGAESGAFERGAMLVDRYRWHDATGLTVEGAEKMVEGVQGKCKLMVSDQIRRSEIEGTTHLHVELALSLGSTPHAIFCSWQKKQAIAFILSGLHFVDGNFNTPGLALGFGADTGSGTCNELATFMLRCMLDVGIPILGDENDEESGVGLRASAQGRVEEGVAIHEASRKGNRGVVDGLRHWWRGLHESMTELGRARRQKNQQDWGWGIVGLQVAGRNGNQAVLMLILEWAVRGEIPNPWWALATMYGEYSSVANKFIAVCRKKLCNYWYMYKVEIHQILRVGMEACELGLRMWAFVIPSTGTWL
ncbi:hypothetical protein EDB83DRAFT_2318774 [Lactarius deliciosus]|nr:hypothetical protein EDB83DRAFT_2318774 [Lactarius deliciosus]